MLYLNGNKFKIAIGSSLWKLAVKSMNSAIISKAIAGKAIVGKE